MSDVIHTDTQLKTESEYSQTACWTIIGEREERDSLAICELLDGTRFKRTCLRDKQDS
jgi:hypothetical protein